MQVMTAIAEAATDFDHKHEDRPGQAQDQAPHAIVEAATSFDRGREMRPGQTREQAHHQTTKMV